MSKKKESLLGLTPATPPRLSMNGSHSLFSESRAITPREQYIADQWHEQTLTIEAQAAKVVFGLDKLGDIDQHAATTFGAIAGHIQVHRQEAQGTPQQHYVDEFSHHLTGVSARHVLGAVDVGAANIGVVIQEPLSAPRQVREESQRKGFWQRLLGG